MKQYVKDSSLLEFKKSLVKEVEINNEYWEKCFEILKPHISEDISSDDLIVREMNSCLPNFEERLIYTIIYHFLIPRDNLFLSDLWVKRFEFVKIETRHPVGDVYKLKLKTVPEVLNLFPGSMIYERHETVRRFANDEDGILRVLQEIEKLNNDNK